MRFRQVHLDFHTGEHVPDVGKDFDKKQFQSMLKKGHVDSITVFSKCHHGWSYHPTEANEMHPALTFDLLGAQIEACHEIGVNAPGYISAGFDEKYARTHPEHLNRPTPDSGPDFSTPRYHLICFNTPYLQILEAQVKEMCTKYDVDGVFLDIVKPRICYCENCVRSMKERGWDPYDEENARRFGEELYCRYTAAMRKAVDSVKPGLPIYHNGGATPRGRRDMEFMNSHVEIESLPTGGWGYDNLPLIARYVQSHGRDYLGMTGKFHLTWGEFGGYKHPNALIYETGRAVAHGGKCSIGDQLHPRGVMDPETYRIIGEAYERIEKLEPWLDHVSAVADVGLLSCEAMRIRSPEIPAEEARDSDLGALRILLEGHYLFDVLDEENDFDGYKLILLPDNIPVEGALREKLTAFLAHGGKILASGRSGVSEGRFVFDFGARYEETYSLSPAYLRPEAPVGPCGVADYVLYAPTEKVSLTTGKALAEVRLPYFNRTAEHFCSHRHTPQNPEGVSVGACTGKDGGYIANRIFLEYATVGSQFAKQLALETIDRLLGAEKTLTADLPGQADVTLMEQKKNRRQILHLLYAPRVMKGTRKIEVIEDCVPLFHIPVSIRTQRRVSSVTLIPSGEEIPFRKENDRIFFTVPKVEIHTAIAIQYED